MKNITKLFFAVMIFSFVSSSHAAPMMVTQQRDCFVLGANIKSDTMSRYATSMADIGSRYDLVKRFSTGKGGGYVALVRDRASGVEKVLKIFPSIASDSNKYNYREPYYTCINGFITYSDIGFKVEPVPTSNLFPRLYEVGLTDSFEYGSKGSAMVFPYIVFEFVKGVTLTSLGEGAKMNSASAGYRLYRKGDASANAVVKRQTEAIMYQIAHILYKMKRLIINGKEYGFYHADLNSGNIMVKDSAQRVTMNAGFGNIVATNMPLVTFIDFGHSTSNFDDELGSKVNSLKTTYHKTVHIFSGSTGEFYKNLNGESLSKASELAIGLLGSNSDIRLYRVMARAIYDSGNFVREKLMDHLKSCTTTTECVTKAPSLFQ